MTIEWRSKMSVGEPMIDNDHKRLLNLINDYEEAIKAKSIESLKIAFENLLEYTVIHFNREEKLMLAIHYKGYRDHKILHQILIDSMNKFHSQLLQKERHISISEVNNFMHDWLIKHILDEDMKMKPLLTGRNLRGADMSWQ